MFNTIYILKLFPLHLKHNLGKSGELSHKLICSQHDALDNLFLRMNMLINSQNLVLELAF